MDEHFLSSEKALTKFLNTLCCNQCIFFKDKYCAHEKAEKHEAEKVDLKIAYRKYYTKGWIATPEPVSDARRDMLNVFAGACSHMLSNKTTENFIKYIIWWEKDFIKLYYNGYLVRHITDKEVLYKMNEPQVIIIGTGVQEKFGVNNISPLIVNNIEVYQKI